METLSRRGLGINSCIKVCEDDSITCKKLFKEVCENFTVHQQVNRLQHENFSLIMSDSILKKKHFLNIFWLFRGERYHVLITYQFVTLSAIKKHMDIKEIKALRD